MRITFHFLAGWDYQTFPRRKEAIAQVSNDLDAEQCHSLDWSAMPKEIHDLLMAEAA